MSEKELAKINDSENICLKCQKLLAILETILETTKFQLEYITDELALIKK